jgi:glutathione S-transferase
VHQLIHISFSPWSERARWALDHHGIPHRRVPYLPGLDEPALRWRLGAWRGRLTIPVLLPDDGPPLRDSLDIARWADARGSGPTLFPNGLDDAILGWHALSEELAAAGRVLATRRTLADPAALAEALPPLLRRAPAIGLPIGRASARNLLRKYDPATSSDEACAATLERGLEQLRAALDGRGQLLDVPTFADVSVVAALTFVRPPEGWRGLGPASRRAWTRDDLVARFPDVLAWRDRLWSARPRHAALTAR